MWHIDIFFCSLYAYVDQCTCMYTYPQVDTGVYSYGARLGETCDSSILCMRPRINIYLCGVAARQGIWFHIPITTTRSLRCELPFI